MAKKDLAGLAALGALGYMLTRDKGGDSNPTRGAGYQSTETREEPRRQITDYMKTAPMGNREESLGAAADAAAKVVAPRVPPAAVADNTTDIAMPTGVTPGGLAKRTEGNQPMPSLQAVEAKIATPKYQAATDAMKNASRAINREAKTSYAATREPNNPELNKKFYASGADADAMKNASRAAAAADAARRRAQKASAAAGMKKGGAVKKMASGGTARSASQRADGIASRGKTKCKMY